MECVLRGDFGCQLPKQDTNLVRIFLSSTFGDFIEERNKLAQETFPRLQQYCQTLGLEFQVVDMRWGVRDENISYHQTSEVCIQEIHNCQRLSIGPSFVALIGDRYGYRPFPAQIPHHEFELFLGLGSRNDIDTTILTKWYIIDTNTLHKVYQLLPITVHFPNYSSKDKTLMAADRNGWWVTFLEIQRTLWTLVKVAVEQGHMTSERAHIYLQSGTISVTEDEITHGIFNATSPNDTCLCYTRTMPNLTTSLSEHLANKYIDLSPNVSIPSIDDEAQQFLKDLKFQKLPAALGSNNMASYTVSWRPGGINQDFEEHRMYLEQLCIRIFHDIKSLIDKALKVRGDLKKSALHAETLHHVSLCLTKAKSYCDRKDDVIDRIREFVKSPANKPLIVYGKSGSGKTSIIAKIVHSLKSWTNETSFAIVRFLGTSPLSSTIREALISISEQICFLYTIPPPPFQEMDGLGVTQYFKDKLMDALKQTQSIHKLYLVIDSVDQLSTSDGAHSMKWLPLVTPPNVKIIVSMLSEGYNCLQNVQSLLPFSTTNYVEVGPMASEAGLYIMSKWLTDIGRTVTPEQLSLITEAFLCCPQPLFLKLLFGRVRTWKSYTNIETIGALPKSTHDALDYFYRTLEDYFGKVLVEKALGYLSASREGITEFELEHVLSLDNQVLNDVYQYWDPPVKGVIRVPSLLWKRIHHFISDYIVEQLSGGVTVMVWYHRQFIESALARYVNDDTRLSLHGTLTEYFNGSYANGKGRSVELTHRDLELVDADRQVPSQPLVFGEHAYNYRKLNELPYHMLHSEQFDTLKSTILCNFSWIHTQLEASGYSKLMRDYIETQQVHKLDQDVSIVSDALSLSHSSMQLNPDMLAGQLLGRMLKFCSLSPILNCLIENAKQWISNYENCIFRPLNNCLISPGGELKATISGHPQVVLGIKKSPTSDLIVSFSRNEEGSLFQVWNVKSLECIENISTLKLPGKELPKGNNFVIAGEHVAAISAQSYILWNMSTGVVLDLVDLGQEFACLAITHDEKQVLIGTANGHILIKTLETPCIPETDSEIVTNKPIVAIYLTQDDHTIIAILENHTIVFLDNTSQSICQIGRIKDFESTTAISHHIAENSSGKVLLAVGTEKGDLHFVDSSTFKVSSVRAHSKSIKCITSVSSINALVTGSLDKLLKVWDLNTFSLLRTLKGHVNGVWCLDSIPQKSAIVSGSKDDYLKVWDIESGECIHTLEGHSSWIASVCAVSSDVIASGSNDKNLKIWKLSSGINTFDSSTRHLAQPECIALCDSTLAASGGPDALKLWNPHNGECYMSAKSPTSCVMFTSDGNKLISGTKEGSIEVRDCINPNFSLLQSVKKHTDNIIKLVEISSNCFVSASMDSTVIVWLTDSLKVETIFQSHTSGVTCIRKSNSHTMLATGSSDCVVHLWDLKKLKPLGALKGHTKTINCIAFDNHDAMLVTGSDDRTARVWNIFSLTCIWTIEYKDSVKVISFVDDATFLAGVHCSRKQLKSWSTKTGKCVNDFNGHTHAVMCMLVLDNIHFVTGSRDGTIKVWNSASSKPLCSYDLQSQVKHVAVSKVSPLMNSKCYLLVCTTKTGPIAFLSLLL